jgi:hypothetical protein
VAVEALAVQLAIALEPTGDMPPVAADKLDQPSGSVPAVELGIDLLLRRRPVLKLSIFARVQFPDPDHSLVAGVLCTSI